VAKSILKAGVESFIRVVLIERKSRTGKA